MGAYARNGPDIQKCCWEGVLWSPSCFAASCGGAPTADAGTGNRPIPRIVPARLPEAHPRTDRTGITGGMAGSESTTRHPFPEAGRHK